MVVMMVSTLVQMMGDLLVDSMVEMTDDYLVVSMVLLMVEVMGDLLVDYLVEYLVQ